MKLPCPACGAICSAEAWEQDAHRRRAIALRDRLPAPVGPVALSYIALFRTPSLSTRGLSWARVAKLMEELRSLVTSGSVQDRNKPARPTTPEHWGEGIQRMIDTPPRRLPLKDHNYLKAVVWDIADQADRKSESDRNHRERLTGQINRPKMEEPEQIDREWMRKIKEQNYKPARRRSAAGAGAENEPAAGTDVAAEMAPQGDGGAGESLHDQGPDGVDGLPAGRPEDAPELLSGAMGRVLATAATARENQTDRGENT